jgi:hypothetical protein
MGGIPLRAQTPYGSLTGTVCNQSGLRLSQATVTVRNADNAGKAETSPDDNGDYRFEHLPPGKYSIRVAARGRTTVQINDVSIQANKIATVNVTLPESRVRAISVVEVSQAPEPVDVTVPTPAPVAAPSSTEDAKIMDPKFIRGEINAVRERLALSDDQQTKIHELFQQRQVAIAAIRGDEKLSATERHERVRAARLEADQKFRALLNEDQLDEYEQILRERHERLLERKQEASATLSSH